MISVADMDRIIMIRENERRMWALYVEMLPGLGNIHAEPEIIAIAFNRWKTIVDIRKRVEVRGEKR